MSKPDWYREQDFGIGRYSLPDTPGFRATVRASNVSKGLASSGKYPFGLTRFGVKGNSNRNFLEKRVKEGLWEVVKMIPNGNEFIAIIASTRKEQEQELARHLRKAEEIKKLLGIK